MEYTCVDLGSDRCPCILMEAGHCYTCKMISKGKCDCGSLWQGVCPYTEYLQRNKNIMQPVRIRNFDIIGIKSYSPELSVLTIDTPMGFGLKCKDLGTFLMIRWKDWFIPISVLRVTDDYLEQRCYIDVGINATGPKTIGLLKEAMIGGQVAVKGPFNGGLINKSLFSRAAESIIVAKGIAIMPVINAKGLLSERSLDFVIDTSKLPEEFLMEYLGDVKFRRVNLEKDCFEVAEELKENYGYCYREKNKPNLFFMVSPYYLEKLLNLTGFSKSAVIMPNHSNMCCGEGFCGSCSFVDQSGKTVKKCKCIDV